MWRIAVIVFLVLVLDFVLLWVGWMGTAEINMLQLSRAYAAHGDNPTPETQRALDALNEATEIKQFKIRAAFSAAVLALTAGGFFIAGRQFERRRKQIRLSTSSEHVTLRT